MSQQSLDESTPYDVSDVELKKMMIVVQKKK